MDLTKYGHACVRLEKENQRLLIDPGVWTAPDALEGVASVVISHEHADHFDPEAIARWQQENPIGTVHAPAEVVNQLAELGVRADAVSPGDSLDASGFRLVFVGGSHAEIVDGLPHCANVGVVVDKRLYHPGDSLFVPDDGIETLLVPVSGPWLKLGDAIEFVRRVGPSQAFPIHDALLSEIGKTVVDRWLGQAGGTDYRRLDPGDSAAA